MLGSNGGRFYPPGYNLKFESDVTIQLRQLEDLTIQKPYNVQLNSLSYAINDLQKTPQTANFAQSAGSGKPDTAAGWSLKAGRMA